MKRTLPIALAAAALLTAALFVDASSFDRLLREAGLWVERLQRIPALTTDEVDHASLALAGGEVASHRLRARVLESLTTGGTAPVVAIAEQDGEVVLGTFDEGALRLQAGRVPRALDLDERINDFALAADGTLYVATAGGAWRLHPAGQIERVGAGAFTAAAIWKGQAWFASNRGISSLEEEGLWTRGREQGMAADMPNALADCGEVLCVGAVDGLWLWDGTRAKRRSSASEDLPTDWVLAVARGESGIWAGTFDGGLALVTPQQSRRFAPADGLPEGRIQPHALAAVGRAVFAGTPTGILQLRDGSAALVADGLPATEITALAAAREGGLWIGFRGGAARIEIEEDPS